MSNTSSRAIADRGLIQPSEDLRETIDRLTVLAEHGLVPMFDSDKQLFCFRLKRTEAGLIREGISRRYTLITLLGLHRLEETGAVSPIPIKPVLDGLLKDLSWADDLGDVGLALWLCALAAPERLVEVYRRIEVERALAHSHHARQGCTTELAWFLTGLSYAEIACPGKMPCAKDTAVKAYRMLVRNQSEQGVFGHLARNGSLASIVRNRFGTFEDQAYSIYALTKFSQAYCDKSASERALDCALKICEAQGSRGQWWWRYDSSDGSVAGRFPVFSVHQHAMGPMALLALGEAIQSDFTPWIHKGLRWIRDNELAFDMEDGSTNVVWRNVYVSASRRLWSATLAFLLQREEPESRHGLEVMFECRPYELGWLLYAFANWNRPRSLPVLGMTPKYDA